MMPLRPFTAVALLCVIFSLQGCLAAPTIVSSKWTYKNYRIGNALFKGAVTETTFSQDMYYARKQCNVLPGPNATLKPCCTSVGQTDCHTPLPGAVCLDENGLHNLQANRSAPILFDAIVADPTSCDRAILTVEALRGDPSVYFSFSDSLPDPGPTHNHHAQSNSGTEWLDFCCAPDFQQALVAAGSSEAWTGRIIGKVVPTGTFADFNVFMDHSKHMNITRYWRRVGPTIVTDKGHYVPSGCIDGLLCGLLAPVDDPVAMEFRTKTIFPDSLVYKPRTHTLALVLELRLDQPAGKVTYNFVPEQALLDRVLQLGYAYTLYPENALYGLDSSGNPDYLQNNGLVTPERYRPACTSKAFGDVSGLLRNSILRISDPNVLASLDSLDSLTNSAFSYVLSDAWTGCEEMAREELLSLANKTTTTESLSCPYATTDPAWSTDPCCNPVVSATTCCAPKKSNTTKLVYQPLQSALDASCSYPRCAATAAVDYGALMELDILNDGCGGDLRGVVNQIASYVSAPQNCFANTYGKSCFVDSDCGSSGWCSSTGTCVTRCKSNSDCGTNICSASALYNNELVCVTLNETNPAERESAALLNCVASVADNPDAFDQIIRKQFQVGATATLDAVATAMWASHTIPKCIGPLASGSLTTEAACLNSTTCNWLMCDSSKDPTCNAENCVTNARSADFCGECHGDFCAEKSEFGGCFAQTTGLFNCSAIAAGTTILWPSGECLLPSSFDRSNCLLLPFCSNETSCAQSFCYDPTVASAAECALPNKWREVGASGVCVTVASNTACATNATLRWWPGLMYRSGAYNTSSSCVGRCVGRSDITTAVACNSASYCDGASAVDSTSCAAAGTCADSALIGCILPLTPNGNCFSGAQKYGDYLCRSTSFTPAQCAQLGGQYRSVSATTQASCELYTCTQPNGATSFITETACTACGGKYNLAISWTPAVWRPARWVPYSWVARSMVSPNYWAPSLDLKPLTSVMESYAANSYARVFQSELYCRYDRSASALSSLACNCGSDKVSNSSVSAATNGSCAVNAISRPIISIAELCPKVALTANFSLGSLVVPRSSTPAATNSSSGCSDVTFRAVVETQFAERNRVSLSSSFIGRGQGSRVKSVRYIKNAFQVVVGEIIGDGVQFNFAAPLKGPATACVVIPFGAEARTKSGALFSFYSIGIIDSEFTSVSVFVNAPVVSIAAPGIEQLCVPITGSVTLFPIVLVDQWQTISFWDALPKGEAAVMIIAALIFSCLLAATLFHLLMHLKTHRGTFLTLPKTALSALFVFLVFRVIYFLAWPNGIASRYPAFGVLFGEFPPIVFMVVYSVIVARWAQIFHHTMSSRGSGSEFGKLQPILFTADGVLVVAFAILVILFFTLPSDLPASTCATPLEQLDARAPAEIVAIAYKFFYAAVCLILSALFCVYGYRIIQVVRSSDKLQGKNKDNEAKGNKKLLRLIAVTSVCTVALLAQVINLIHSSFSAERNIYGVLVALLIIEVVPCIIFLNLFMVRSDFVQRVKDRLRQTFGNSRTVSTGDINSAAISRTDSVRDTRSFVSKSSRK